MCSELQHSISSVPIYYETQSDIRVKSVGPCGLNNLKRDRLRMKKTQQQSIEQCSLKMQDTIDCNKINKIREEKMQTQFYTGSATSRAYVQYSSNPLEISTIFVKSFTTSEPHRDNPSLVFRNPYNSRDLRSLN